MDDLELLQYLFDLQGFVILENVLSKEEVATLNAIVDAQNLSEPGLESDQRFGRAAGSGPEGTGFLNWGQPFCDLLDHPRILPLLRVMLGDYIRLDRIYGIHMRKGTDGLVLHGGGAPYSPGEFYHFIQGRIENGFVVVAWNLTDTGPGKGGFFCIPGSHKSNFKLPQTLFDAHDRSSVAYIPEAPAGSAIFFTEALTHGTAPWQADFQRRSVLYKYCQSQLAWSAGRVQLPADIALTPRQQILFREPADPGRYFPSLFEDSQRFFL
jgi:hypothetical protein